MVRRSREIWSLTQRALKADSAPRKSALLQNLLSSGLVAVDDMDMGVRVDADHSAIDRSGGRSEILFALGPLLRGTYWETVAVPELRVQARRVAETLLGRREHLETRQEDVMMEYMI